MSLEQKVEDYIQIIQGEDSYSSLGAEIIEDMKNLVTTWQTQTPSSDQSQSNINQLWSSYIRLPDSFFDNYSQDILEVILVIPCHQVYKAFQELNIFLPNTIDPNIKPNDVDKLALLMLSKYITKVSAKELVLYIKSFTEQKFKNLQLRFLLIELLNYAIINIAKKEAFLPDLLPSVLKLLHESLHKYNKYKGRINNQEYTEIPPEVLEYTTHYEAWIKHVLQKFLETLANIIKAIEQSNERPSILLISELYDGASSTYIQDKTLGKNKLINHYCVLFCLDLIWLVLEHGKQFLSQDTQIDVNKALLDMLLSICPTLNTYLLNYANQTRLLSIDTGLQDYSKRDPRSLPSEPYHALTLYNPAAMSYLAIQLLQSVESTILSAEYKLALLIPCIDRLFGWPTRNDELKREVISAANLLLTSLLEHQNQAKSIVNINKFGIPLDRVLERILDYSGGPIDPKDRAVGLDFFANIKKILNDKAIADLLLLTINKTKNPALSGFLITEFKSGINNTLRVSGGGEELKDSSSPFLNVNYLGRFFKLVRNPQTGDLKDEYEIIASCVNVLMLIYLKYSFLVKNVPNYMQLEFKDHSSLFRPGNLGILLRYGERVIELQKRISDDIEVQKKYIGELEQNKADQQTLSMYQMKFYELVMMHDSITRIEEIYKELKSLADV